MISKYMKIQKKTKRRKSEIKVRGGTYSQYCCICVPTCRTSISKSFGTLKGSCSQLVYFPPHSISCSDFVLAGKSPFCLVD